MTATKGTSSPGGRAVTHAELVQRASRWLRTSRRCVVVLAESGAFCASLIPDAVGWTSRGESILIECKVSRADFKHDRHKPGHRGGYTIGARRYFMTPAGLLAPEEIPDDWGLLEVHTTQVRVVKEAPEATTNRQQELVILLAETRRIAEGWRKPGDKCGLQSVDDDPIDAGEGDSHNALEVSHAAPGENPTTRERDRDPTRAVADHHEPSPHSAFEGTTGPALALAQRGPDLQ